MTVTYNNTLRLADIATGTEIGTWGDVTDTNIISLLTQAVAGVGYVNITANNTTDQILTVLNGAVDESRSAVLGFVGTLTVTKNIIIPNSNKVYHVVNATSGGTLVIKPAGATLSVSVPPGSSDIIFCDGTNAYSVLAPKLSRYLPLTGGTMSGQLVVQNGGILTTSTSGSGTSTVYVQSFYGNDATIYLGNTRGPRWAAVSSSEVEAAPGVGSNIGSNLSIGRLSDAGLWIDAPLHIERVSGLATFIRPPRVTPPGSVVTPNDADLTQSWQFQHGIASTAADGTVVVAFSRTVLGVETVICQPLANGVPNFQIQVTVHDPTVTGFSASGTINSAPAVVSFFWFAFVH
jgi:hypothetical protein